MHGMKWKEKEWESREGKQTEMDRIKVGEFPYQNSRVEHGILGRHAVKGMPIQGIQMRSQVMLNVASVILKGIKTNKISENLPCLFRSAYKKKKKGK